MGYLSLRCGIEDPNPNLHSLVNLCSTVVEIQYTCFGLPKNQSVKNCANYQSNYVESELQHFKNTKYFYCELVTLIL